MSPEVLSPEFQKVLKREKYFMGDIMLDLIDNKRDPLRILRRWTELPDDTLRKGIYKIDRDELSPRISEAITEIIKAWTDTNTDEGLPLITVKELSRATSLDSETIIKNLVKYPLSFTINGTGFSTSIQSPKFPGKRLTIKDSRNFGLSPLRVARSARYQSRPPGGGPVQKAGIQNEKVNNIIRKRAWTEQKIQFNKALPAEIDITFSETKIPIKPQNRNKSAEEIIYSESEGAKLMEVFRWFKENGFGKNWAYGGNENAFAEKLIRFSRNEPVDFLIWNCLGFRWSSPTSSVSYPPCTITSNNDAAIALYFRSRIEKMIEVLSKIGDPEITILVPSNEAFSKRTWNYLQSTEEREKVIDEAVAGLKFNFRDAVLPSNARINIQRWDDFLKARGISKSAEEYSIEGERKVRQSNNYQRILDEAIKSGRKYFADNGITDISDIALRDQRPKYYGIYAGEGIAFEDMQKNGNNIVIINFEEMRVPQMASLGANGNLSIVTPITPNEMTRYYQWENRQKVKK